jgi:hypothetical protein
MSWNLSYCSFAKTSSHVYENLNVQAIQSPWVQSCEILFVGAISDNASVWGSSYIRNDTCEDSIKFVYNPYDSSLLDFSSVVTLPLGGDYLNQLYWDYYGVFEYNQSCPICNDPYVAGNFSSICYGNCTASQRPYIFDSSFEIYDRAQCLAQPVLSFSYATSTSTPTLVPITNKAVSILPSNILLAIFLLLAALKIN